MTPWRWPSGRRIRPAWPRASASFGWACPAPALQRGTSGPCAPEWRWPLSPPSASPAMPRPSGCAAPFCLASPSLSPLPPSGSRPGSPPPIPAPRPFSSLQAAARPACPPAAACSSPSPAAPAPRPNSPAPPAPSPCKASMPAASPPISPSPRPPASRCAAMAQCWRNGTSLCRPMRRRGSASPSPPPGRSEGWRCASPGGPRMIGASTACASNCASARAPRRRPSPRTSRSPRHPAPGSRHRSARSLRPPLGRPAGAPQPHRAGWRGAGGCLRAG